MKKVLLTIMVTATLTLMPATAQAKTINMGRFKLTAFCPCYECSCGYGRKCAMKGRHCRSKHTIAVDPDIIDLGSKVKIGKRIYTAEDTGGAVEGDVIDIFFDTHEEVEKFGVKHANVVVVR